MTINPFAIMQEEFDHTGIVFNPDSNKVMTLNASGVELWKAFEKNHSIEEAALMLTEKFEVNIDTARRDAEAFAKILVEKGLLSLE